MPEEDVFEVGLRASAPAADARCIFRMMIGTPGHDFCTDAYMVSILPSHHSISSRVSGVLVEMLLATDRLPKYARSQTASTKSD